jgi:hypothetical protein
MQWQLEPSVYKNRLPHTSFPLAFFKLEEH